MGLQSFSEASEGWEVPFCAQACAEGKQIIDGAGGAGLKALWASQRMSILRQREGKSVQRPRTKLWRKTETGSNPRLTSTCCVIEGKFLTLGLHFRCEMR